MASVAEVDVLNYESCRSYLRDYLEWKRERNPRFGVRWLAKRAQLSTPSSLSMILTGARPMSEKIAEKLVQAIGLSGRRKKYFLLLRRLDSADSDKETIKIKEQLMNLKSAVDQSLMEVRQYKVISEWYYIAVYVLLGLKDVKQDLVNLSSLLKQGITEDQVQQAIEDLLELGMIEKISDRYEPTQKALTTSDEIGELAMFRYHEQMIDRARQAIHLKPEEREFCGITLGVPADKMSWLKNRVREFRQEINEKLSQFDQGCDVYQMNINIFPLVKTKKTGERKL